MEYVPSFLKSPLGLAVMASGTAMGLFVLKRVFWKKKSGPRIANYKKDLVYVFHIPSCRTIVSISPFGLKLETWLRMHRIRHTVKRQMGSMSSKGQIPFIELNGQEYNESNLIIEKLSEYFGVSDGLKEEQQGCARGLEMMLENHTSFSYFYYRYVEDASNFIKTWEFLGFFLRRFLLLIFPRNFKRRVQQHGIGRNTVEEIYAMGCSDILALSKVLGDKQFLFGNQMTTADCYAFGHLSQILYVPVAYPHKQFMREKTPNLCDYVERIRAQLWPDWDQLCLENLHGSKDE